jgi:taurine dioxygenase
MTTRSTLDVRPIAGYIGAEVHGVDLTQPLDAEVVAEIRTALLQWKVVFFRDQHLTQTQHIALGGYFGEVTPAHPTMPPAFPDHPEIFSIDNLHDEAIMSMVLGDDARPESRWHTDVTFVSNPPMGSILRGVEIPAYGGDTQWTNLVAAYDALSAPLQRLCDELHAVHVNNVPLERGVASSIGGDFQSRVLEAVHPVVRVHPETGEKSLFVNHGFTTHIVELSRRESGHLLALLFEHVIRGTFTCRFRWEPGSIAFWDNRATSHIFPTDVPLGERRAMQRITIAGDVPVGPDGFTSYALSGDAFN